jgi:asparagine synthetase B (glutamine-hydrolysing)
MAKAVALAEGGLDDSSQLLAGLSSYLSEDQKADLVAPRAREALLPGDRLFDSYKPPVARDLEELSQRITETLFAVSLPSDMLRKVDMMSMKASIEVRVPLLDEDVVDLGLSLPHRLKTDGHTGKLVPRALARRWLPDAAVNHPKHGFSIPLDVMMPVSMHVAIEDLLCSSDARTAPFVNGTLVRRWLDEFARARLCGASAGAISREGLYQRVIMLLSLELWMRDNNLTW